MQIIKVSILASLLTYAGAVTVPVKRMVYSGVCSLIPLEVENKLSAKFSNSSALSNPVAQANASMILMRDFLSRYLAITRSP